MSCTVTLPMLQPVSSQNSSSSQAIINFVAFYFVIQSNLYITAFYIAVALYIQAPDNFPKFSVAWYFLQSWPVYKGHLAICQGCIQTVFRWTSLKNNIIIKLSGQNVVAVAYQWWSFTFGSNRLWWRKFWCFREVDAHRSIMFASVWCLPNQCSHIIAKVFQWASSQNLWNIFS